MSKLSLIPILIFSIQAGATDYQGWEKCGGNTHAALRIISGQLLNDDFCSEGIDNNAIISCLERSGDIYEGSYYCDRAFYTGSEIIFRINVKTSELHILKQN